MTPTPGMGTPLSRCSLAFTQGWLGAVQKENIYIYVSVRQGVGLVQVQDVLDVTHIIPLQY